ncbi:hypothetical protein GYMLUDRAFT_36743 [Collybiopsis luxurians FD-317 M1]|nr:hypothetical protein GYMLUDRAFT_36743 [Collybiopsis luxurians FD-317 M1]
MSVFDYGALSLYMNPLTGLLTIFFHLPSIMLLYARPDLKWMISVEAAALECLLSLTWLVCFVVMAIISYGSQGKVDVFGINEVFPADVDGTQRMQLIATSLEFALLGDLAIRTTWSRNVSLEDEEKLFATRY